MIEIIMPAFLADDFEERWQPMINKAKHEYIPVAAVLKMEEVEAA